MKKKLVILFIPFITMFILFYFIDQNAILENTTENIQIVSKNNTSEEQWIVLSNNKKIYIEDFSIWALIEEKRNYTIVYDSTKKSKRYKLKKIVPEDYDGQF